MFTNIYLAEIMRLCAEVNDGERFTTFFDYSGHVKLIKVRVYEGKWKKEEEPIFDIQIYTDASKSNDALKQIIVQLTQLLQ